MLSLSTLNFTTQLLLQLVRHPPSCHPLYSPKGTWRECDNHEIEYNDVCALTLYIEKPYQNLQGYGIDVHTPLGIIECCMCRIGNFMWRESWAFLEPF